MNSFAGHRDNTIPATFGSKIVKRLQRGLKARNTQIRDERFFKRTLRTKESEFFFYNFYTVGRIWENLFKSQETFIKPVFFWEIFFFSFINIQILVFHNPMMNLAHISQTPPNMSSIGAVCDALGKTSLTSLVGYY